MYLNTEMKPVKRSNERTGTPSYETEPFWPASRCIATDPQTPNKGESASMTDPAVKHLHVFALLFLRLVGLLLIFQILVSVTQRKYKLNATPHRNDSLRNKIKSNNNSTSTEATCQNISNLLSPNQSPLSSNFKGDVDFYKKIINFRSNLTPSEFSL